MRVKEAFPKKYASGDDLDGKTYTLTIEAIVAEPIWDQKEKKDVDKWVLYFVGAKKGLVLSSRGAKEIAEALGDDEMDNWPGRKIEAYPSVTKAFGKEFTVFSFRKAKQEGPSSSVDPESRAADTIRLFEEPEPPEDEVSHL